MVRDAEVLPVKVSDNPGDAGLAASVGEPVHDTHRVVVQVV